MKIQKKRLLLVTAILFTHFVNAQYLVQSIPFTPPYPFTGGDTTILGGADDLWSDTIDLPFNFSFYNITYNQLVIGTNGIISFDLSNTDSLCPSEFSQPIPSSSLPTNAIFGAYHDLELSHSGNINYSVQGVSPNRAFVLNFDSVSQFGCTNLTTTQQIVLYESTNVIEIYIENKPVCSTWNSGNALIGIQDSTGLIGLAAPVRNTGPWSATNEAWRFYYNPYPNIINGRILLDNNCFIDGTEQGLGGFFVKTVPDVFYGITNNLGEYSIYSDTGTYQVEQVISNSNSILINPLCPTPNYHTVHFDTLGMDTTGIDFFNEGIACPYLTIDINSNVRRRCFTNNTYLNYCNDGYADVTGVEVYVHLPDYVEFISADYPYSIDTSGNYIFDIGFLAQGDCGMIHIIDSVACINGIMGLTQCTKAWITPANDCVNQLDTASYNQWDHSSVMVVGECMGDTIVHFVITNTGAFGSGDMQQVSEYRIYRNALLVQTSTFQLLGQEELIIDIPADGATYRLEADQHPMHPGNSHPNETIENCGDPFNTTGLVNVFPMDDEDVEVEIDCMPIVDSYDPNDKSVSPEGITANHFVSQGTELDYVIRFQNTGSDTAFTVIVVDTLSEYLDISSFQSGVSSHPYELDVNGHGRAVLHFIFNNVNLPDNLTDEPNSHGFVKFKIAPYDSLPNGTVIENTANIYFDYNLPVITNITIVTISDTVIYGNPLGVNNIKDFTTDINIFPNPTSGLFYIFTEGFTKAEIFNSLGEKLLVSDKMNVNISNLSSGVYFVKVFTDKGLITGKIIKK